MSAEYENFGDMWSAALDLTIKSKHIETARQGTPTRRVQGASFKLLNPSKSILDCERRGFSLKYGCAEFIWYLNEFASLQQISHYAPSYKKYASDDYGFYGPRLHIERQSAIEQAARELKADTACRRAVAAPWRTEDVFFGHKSDLPCTLSYQFLVEDGKRVNMIATMRSNDVWLGMPNDVFVNTCIQIAVAKIAGFELGWYLHQVGDLHLYGRHWDVADQVFNEDIRSQEIDYDMTPVRWSDILQLIPLEEEFRLHGRGPGLPQDKFVSFIYKGLLS